MRTQALLMASVTSVITCLLLLLVFFDHPHGDGVGKLHPIAMERTLHLVEVQLQDDIDVEAPCDGDGQPQ